MGVGGCEGRGNTIETNHKPVICPMVVLTKPKRTLPVSPIAMYHRIYSSSFLPPLNAGSSQDSTTDVSVTFTTVTFLGLEGGSVCVCVCVCVRA